jgi:competence protein ComEC
MWITNIILQIFAKEKRAFWLWVPVAFGFGAAFYFTFSENFSAQFILFLALFFVATFFAILDRESYRSLIFKLSALFLLGGFYANFYDKIVLNYTKIEGKVFVDVVGKVEDIRKFYNPVNKHEGANLLIAEPVLYKSIFVKKEKIHKEKVKKKRKKKAKKIKKKKAEKKEKKPRKPRAKKKKNIEEESDLNISSAAKLETGSRDPVSPAALEETEPQGQAPEEQKVEEDIVKLDSHAEKKQRKPRKSRKKKTDVEEIISSSGSESNISTEQSNLQEQENHIAEQKIKTPKPKKPRKISDKKIQKTFANIPNYQDLDRKFLDLSKNYQQINWREVNGRKLFPNSPPKISVNLIKNFENIKVNDVIAARLMLAPARDKEFPDDFDFAADARSKKIGAYGFILGEAKIIQKSDISSLDEWFISIREAARSKITAVLNGDSASIALAFLIGDQNQISKPMMSNIRNSGLAHLLSISGFHLALASAIFLVATRFALSRSEYLALNFDLKKIAAIIAIFATYFYLKLAASPVPAQRSFLMVLFMMLALFAHEKVDARRSVMAALFFLTLANPYNVLNVSFQLSFAAILVLGAFHDWGLIKKDAQRHWFIRFFYYFLEMILISILVQIATLPFLMRYFQNAAMLGFIANILAVPLTSFVIMPFGFLALFFMPIGLEKYALLMMEQGIFWLEKIADFVANLDYSYFTSPQLSKLGMVLAVFGLFLICLSKSRLILVGIAIFSLSFVTLYFVKKPNISFDGKQKFFALFDKENGLIFSKSLKPSKRRELWMLRFQESEFKSLENFSKEQDVFCNKENCTIKKNKKFFILLTRTKTAEICKNDFDIIINLTAHYELPDCIADSKIKIDNLDFFEKGGHFFYLEEEKMRIRTTN